MRPIHAALAGMVAVAMLPLCGPAHANAWQRTAGTGFASMSSQIGWPSESAFGAEPDLMATGFFEYGLTDRLSLGLDLSQTDQGDGKVVLVLQTPLFASDAGHRVAMQMGLGQIAESPVVRPGLSYGFGFSGARASGWLSVDATAAIDLKDNGNTYALDLTYGINAKGGRKYIFQVQSGQSPDSDPFSRLAPSVVLPWGETRNIEMGMTYGLTGDDSVALKLGLWQRF